MIPVIVVFNLLWHKASLIWIEARLTPLGFERITSRNKITGIPFFYPILESLESKAKT